MIIKRLLKALEKQVKTDKDALCLESIAIGFDIMTSMSNTSKDDSDDVSK